MPSGLPLKREVSFLLIQAELVSLRQKRGNKSLPRFSSTTQVGLIQQLSCDVIFQAAITSPS